MTGGSITGNESASVGGGVNIVKKGSMIMTGGVISGNKAATKGGAINIESSAICTITGGKIEGNIAGKLANNIHHEGKELAVGGDVSIEDIYLENNKYITAVSKLGENTVFNVSLEGASSGRIVVQGESANAVNDIVNKIVFVPELAKNLYLDADGVIKSTNSNSVARIGETYYYDLAEAFNAVPKNGMKTTIVVLSDITLYGGIVIEAGQNVVLTDDGAVRTITRGTDSDEEIIS